MKKISLLVCVFGLLGGCASTLRHQPDMRPSDKAGVKLAEAATSVSHSLTELARIQAVATPPLRDNLPDPNGFGMDQYVSVDWAGPVTPILQNIARAGHYKLRILGNEPATPILVSVLAENAPLGDVLRDVAFQAGTKAVIQVNPRQKVIELRYAKT
jgi:defect-in-organelle-trafficking protein DotD